MRKKAHLRMHHSERMSSKPFTLLLVDNNPADVSLMEEAICSWKSPCNVHSVGGGESALDFLYQRKGHENAPRPDLVFLDVGTLGMDGFDVLQVAKQDRALADIPIIVFAADRAPEQVQKAYDLHANAYIVKPLTLDEYLHVLDSTGEYWLKIVCLPSEGC